jgi:hypothetical protein
MTADLKSMECNRVILAVDAFTDHDRAEMIIVFTFKIK